jgi:hypothetical protein
MYKIPLQRSEQGCGGFWTDKLTHISRWKILGLLGIESIQSNKADNYDLFILWLQPLPF